MRILVTGGSGFVGRACADALRARGLEPLTPSASELDVLSDADAAAYLADARPTHLVHAAWRPVRGDVMRSDENAAWAAASEALVRRFREAGGERAACLGSSAEYDWSHGDCIPGVTPLAPASAYGAAKHALHQALEGFAAESGLSLVWPRIFFIYGPGEHESRLCAHVLKNLLHDQPAELTHGRQIRDYVFVRDVGEGVVAALLSDFEGATDIATGVRRSVRDLVTEFGRQLGKLGLLHFDARPAPAHDAPVVMGDPSHAREHIGWTAATSLEDGVAETIAWGRERFAA